MNETYNLYDEADSDREGKGVPEGEQTCEIHDKMGHKPLKKELRSVMWLD